MARGGGTKNDGGRSKTFAWMLRGGLTGTVTFEQGGGGVSPLDN